MIDIFENLIITIINITKKNAKFSKEIINNSLTV